MKVNKKKRQIQIEMTCRRVVNGNIFNMILPDTDKFEVGKAYKFFLVGSYLGKAKLLEERNPEFISSIRSYVQLVKRQTRLKPFVLYSPILLILLPFIYWKLRK